MRSSQAFELLPSPCLALRSPQDGALASAVSSETSRLGASPGSRARGHAGTSACFLHIPSASVKYPYRPMRTDTDVDSAHTAVVQAKKGRHTCRRCRAGPTAWRFDLVTETKGDFLEEVMRLLSFMLRRSQPGWGKNQEMGCGAEQGRSARESCPAAS